MGKPINILFVEDSDEDVELTEMELIRGGFEPATRRVDTPEDMREALHDQCWDLVISDYSMPRFSAEGALEVLRQSGLDLPFIILSGAVEAVDAVTLLKHGAHDFLNKAEPARLIPAVERELREAIERAQRRHAEERVRILSLAVEQSPVSVVITDRNGIISYVNPKFEEVTGFSAAEAIGRNLNFTVTDRSRDGSFSDLWDTVGRGEDWSGEFCNVRRDGQLFWEYARVSPLTDQAGVITHYVCVKEDITVRRIYEEQLLKQAQYDDLTGLANRVLMRNRLDAAIEGARRRKETAALLCIDLDRFKNVNDSLGHGVGDDLLKEAAARLGGCVRRGDTLARMGGDEFVVILPSVNENATIQRIVERILSVFGEPFHINGQDHFVTASIGITVAPDDGDDHQTLLRNADLAMYRAKELGRNRYQYFVEEINVRLKERLDLEARLRGVVGRGELALFYQPILDLHTGYPVSVEALLRWRKPDGGYHMPGAFIPLAEDVGLIKEIGEWVVATACSEIAPLLGRPGYPTRLSVNVSPMQLQARGFAQFVEGRIVGAGLQPGQLELEITERVLVDDTPETRVNLNRLCELGVSLSIDDFGTGYSSLGYLQKYPFQTLKIDRSFISEAVVNANSARLVETIITMAHSLGLNVIAEGVETDEQLSFLYSRAAPCNQVQGFLFGPPVPVRELPRWLKNGPTLGRRMPRGVSVVK